jgi:class 3 adenylate cyclase/pimeloyl-ACP methyl ester carboxylesterase
VNCPRCQHDAPSDAEFCPACGTRLSLVCSHCATANAAGDRFCKKCGRALEPAADGGRDPAKFASPHSYTPHHLAEKILTSRHALEGERKLVTVLFVDVSGFTAISEKLDPEDVHDLMDHAFELMLREIHRYEGTVNQFLGDGLMALFGAPIAHEDHAQRAVHAALGMTRALAEYRRQIAAERGIDFQVRMGVNTGGVVVGKIGDNLRMDYTAVGDTTNLAARLLALAEPGQILASEELFKAAGPYFVLQPLGEVAVKGKALPVRAYRVERARTVRSRIEAVSDVGLTPLVGRERELALLQDRFAEAREGRGQAVFVFGEAGIGKSRLLAEFRRAVEAGGGARWLIGRSVSYGQTISYLPVIDLLRDLFDIEETHDVQTMLTKIGDGIRQLGADVRWTEPFVRALLALDPGDEQVRSMIPAQRQGRSAEAVRALVTRLGQQGPVIVLVEDLHWIDPRSEDVVRLLLDGIAALPVLTLLTHRPGYAHPFGEQTYYTRITLHGLAEALTGTMVERVLGSSDVPSEARALILRKAEGNPLFVEELSKALVEDGTLSRENGGYRLARGIGDAAIPNTIQGVIMARIDRLPEASKSALQIASVIGREFTARLVERVSAIEREAPKVLGELRAVELIYEKSIYPELAYMFKHALTHDVAYESLLRQRRRALHRRVGEVIEELYPDRLPEFYETLAWHFTLGDVWAKAVDYLLRASDKARAQFAYTDASRYASDAVEILERHGASAADKLRALEAVADLESLLGRVDAANQAYDRAFEVASDDTARQRILNKRHRPGFAVRDGRRIAYYEHGTRGPILFFMHPTVYGIATFQPLVELLSDDFRIVTVDPLGTGASDPLPAGYHLHDQAEDARGVIGALGAPPVVLVGMSRGGQLAMDLAAAWPEAVEKLVLIGTTPTWHGAADAEDLVNRAFFTRQAELVRAGDYEQAIAAQIGRGLSEPGLQKMAEGVIRRWRQLAPDVLRNFFGEDDPSRELRHVLPRIGMPTLVLHGEDDRLVPVEAGRYLAEHIPGALLHVFKGRGHVPFVTAPTEFTHVLRSFIFAGRLP